MSELKLPGKIICTSDTKRMLLRLEAELDRKHHDGGVREKQKRKYEGLRPRLVGKGTKEERLVDMIVRPLRTATRVMS